MIQQFEIRFHLCCFYVIHYLCSLPQKLKTASYVDDLRNPETEKKMIERRESKETMPGMTAMNTLTSAPSQNTVYEQFEPAVGNEFTFKVDEDKSSSSHHSYHSNIVYKFNPLR